MSRRTKLILMFAPLVLLFAALVLVVGDMRHPTVQKDRCVITAVGTDAQDKHSNGQFIYRQSENRRHDVSLQCNRFGNLLLNDFQLFITPIQSGQAADVSLKIYRYLPERWLVSVYTGKPEG